jgi:hypothetical protein
VNSALQRGRESQEVGQKGGGSSGFNEEQRFSAV